VKVLYVCTANICRSPSAAEVLRAAVIPGVEVRSAGTAAVAGAPGCTVAPLLAGIEHASQPLTRELVQWADLVLTAAREHQAAVVGLDAGARSRTFTLRQAGRLAQWLLDTDVAAVARERAVVPDGDRFGPDDPRSHVAPMPAGDRSAWLVAELDAARGYAAPPPPEPATGRWRRRVTPVPPDDVPDPHVLGSEWHGPAAEQITAAAVPLLILLREVIPASG